MTVFAGSLDANVLLRLLLNDVADQHQAALNLIQSTKTQLLVADTAIIEVIFVLERHYEFSRTNITEAIEGLTLIAQLQCNQKLIQPALQLFVKHPSLSFEDCCLAVYAELNNAEPLWTFDRKLARQAITAKLVPIN